jgi:hypothetical protein
VKRRAHLSWSVFGVFVLILALYWQSIIEDLFVGFYSPWGFPRIKCCVPCDYVSFSDPLYAVVFGKTLKSHEFGNNLMKTVKT